MKPTKKKVIRLAAACVAAGLLICLIALAALDFNYFELATMEPVTNTYAVTEHFTDIVVRGAECDVRLLPSEDGACTVLCNETDRITHHVAVENRTLVIHRTDNRKWYEHIGFMWQYWGPIEVIVYLPDRAYETLELRTASGDIDVPDDFSFARADADTSSGSIHWTAEVRGNLSLRSVSGGIAAGGTGAETLSLHSTSGNIAVDSVKVNGAFSCQTVSGRLKINDMTCQSATVYATSGDVTVDALKADTEFSCKTISGKQDISRVACQSAVINATSGSVTLSDLIASETLHMEAVSGDLKLIDCDAAALWLKTVSGSIMGTLRTEKVFDTHTTSGSIRVPNTVTGGTCEARTVSGAINLELSDKETAP